MHCTLLTFLYIMLSLIQGGISDVAFRIRGDRNVGKKRCYVFLLCLETSRYRETSGWSRNCSDSWVPKAARTQQPAYKVNQMWQDGNHSVNKTHQNGIKVSNQLRSLHNTLNLFAQFACQCLTPYWVFKKTKNGQPLIALSVDSGDVPKTYEEFNSITLAPGRPVGPWMAGAQTNRL